MNLKTLHFEITERRLNFGHMRHCIDMFLDQTHINLEKK